MPPSCSVSTPRWSRRFHNPQRRRCSMMALAVVIGIVFAAAVAVLACALAFPDRLGGYLPEVLQASVAARTQLVLCVKPDGVDVGQAVAQSISIIERRLK